MTADKLRAVRLYNGLTQQQFAERLGVSQGLIGRIECGDARVSDKVRAAIIKNFTLDSNFINFYSLLKNKT